MLFEVNIMIFQRRIYTRHFTNHRIFPTHHFATQWHSSINTMSIRDFIRLTAFLWLLRRASGLQNTSNIFPEAIAWISSVDESEATGCNSHVTQLCQLISHQRQQRRDHQTRWTRFLSFPMSHEIENKWGNVERSTFSWSSGSNQQAHLCRPNMHRWLVFGLLEFQFLVTKLPCPIFDCIMYRSHPWPLNSWLPGKYTLQISQISKTFVSSQWFSASTISQWTRARRPEWPSLVRRHLQLSFPDLYALP